MGMMFKFPYKESPYLVVPAVTAKNCCRAENAAKPRARRCSGTMCQSPTPHPSEPLRLGMWLSFNFLGDRLHKFTKKTSSSSATMSTGIFL